MQTQFEIKNVKCFTQRDNVNDPLTACFNTSVGMVTDYCLTSIGKDKTALGCALNMQIEDYIYEALADYKTKLWMDANTWKFGSWIWNYARRTVYCIEEYIFNRLMNPFGFKATFYEEIGFDALCETMEKNNLPGVIGGDFSSVSAVRGHMNCLLGWNAIGVKEFIVNDPFGNALRQYTDQNGEHMQYATRFYGGGRDKFNVLLMSKI